jgi:hypothetical protein
LLLDRLDVVRNRIAFWSQRQAETEAMLWQGKLQELISKKETLERQIAELAGEKPEPPVKPTAGGVGSRLADTDAFVDLFEYDLLDGEPGSRSRYAAFLIRSDGTLKFIQLGSASDIDAAVRQWRNSIDLPSRTGWRFLRSLVWNPISDAMGDRVKTVWVSPDAELSAVPWQLFADEMQDGSDRTSGALIRQVNSARDFIEMIGRANGSASPPREPPSMVILGGLDYGPVATKGLPEGECWPPLDGTRNETDLVEGLAKAAGFTPILVQGAEATKSRVVELLESSAFAHLATHGFFSPNLPNNLSGCSFREALVMNSASFKANVSTRIPFFRSGLALSEANKRAPEPLTVLNPRELAPRPRFIRLLKSAVTTGLSQTYEWPQLRRIGELDEVSTTSTPLCI